MMRATIWAGRARSWMFKCNEKYGKQDDFYAIAT